MLQLASLMLKLKCNTAINLDGGGLSSFLFIEEKIVNRAIGNKDEGLRQSNLYLGLYQMLLYLNNILHPTCLPLLVSNLL
ncbi:MAG: phosphodiester glycosidase family protein [Candidatus Amoebophilus sp.]